MKTHRLLLLLAAASLCSCETTITTMPDGSVVKTTRPAPFADRALDAGMVIIPALTQRTK